MSTPYRSPISRGLRLRVVALLALAAFINFVDRGNLATAAPLIRDELGLSNAQLGVLLSAFFWSYVRIKIARVLVQSTCQPIVVRC